MMKMKTYKRKILSTLFLTLAIIATGYDSSFAQKLEKKDLSYVEYLEKSGTKVVTSTERKEFTIAQFSATAGKRALEGATAGVVGGAAAGALAAGVGAPIGAAFGLKIGFLTGLTIGTVEYFSMNKIEVSRYRNSEGKEYSYTLRGNIPVYHKGAFNGCEVLPSKIYEFRKCVLCPLFSVIFRAADNMTVLSFKNLSGAFSALISLALGIYIAYSVFFHVGNITKQNASKLIGSLAQQSFKFLIAFLLLQYSTEIYKYVINPILFAGLSFGQALLISQSDVPQNAQVEIVNTVYYTPSLYYALENYISEIQKNLGYILSIGTSMVCIGSQMIINLNLLDLFGKMADGFYIFVEGLIISGFGLSLLIAFAFYLIDAILQLGIVGAIMPFLIACWPFKTTSKYTKKGFDIILNSFFFFIFMGLIMRVNMELINSALGNMSEDNDVVNEVSEETIKSGMLHEIYEAITGQHETRLIELTDISGVAFLILIVACIFGFKLCGEATKLANKMASGAVSGIGSGIGTMAASAVTGAAKGVSSPFTKRASAKIGNAVDKAPAAIVNAPGKAINAVKKRFSKKSNEN